MILDMEETYIGEEASNLHDIVKKDRKPFLEMKVTALVEAKILA